MTSLDEEQYRARSFSFEADERSMTRQASFLGLLVSLFAVAACSGSGPGTMTANGAARVGENIYVSGEVDPTGIGLINLHPVPAPTAPFEVIHIQFASETFSSGAVYALTVENFFASPFVYHALIEASGASPKPTDTCPVSPRIKSVELWSDALAAVTVQDVEFRATNDFVCTYY